MIQWSDDDQCFIATLPGWQRARTHGDTVAEAAKNAHEVLELLIKAARERGERIPPVQRSYSGKLNVRLPTSIHERLAREAEREGVSLNQWIVTKLAS